MTKRLFLQATAAAMAGALLPACGGGGGGDGGIPVGSDTLLQMLQQDGRFSALLAAADKAGLTGLLGDAGQGLTLFAPDNDAFDRLGSRIGLGDRNGLVSGLSAAQWTDILNFSLLPQRRTASSLRNTRPDTRYTFPTGDIATLIFPGDGTIWDGVGRFQITLQQSDLAAVNGLIHVPSDVLLPRFVLTVSQMLRANIDSFSNFAQSMPAADITLLDSGGGSSSVFFTAFVPFNPTFTPPLSSSTLRRHHIVQRSSRLLGDQFPASINLTPVAGQTWTLLKSGGTATIVQGGVQRATVTDVDFYASNGVIHVIDAVIPL